MNSSSTLCFLASAVLALASAPAAIGRDVLRVGYFLNITHAQGVIGSHGTSGGDGWFEKHLGGDVEVQWFPFNAGPGAMEAIFAGSIDLTYVGPNPALNAYMRSRGDEMRVLAGAAEGGAALVVPGDGRIAKPADFKGRRVGTPQLGNTQDVAARAWLRQQGFRVTMTGGDVLVVPTENPDQLGLFASGKLDAVWTVEPWVSRLLIEGGGRIYLEQPEAITTILVAGAKLLRERPALAEKFRTAHVALTAWLNENPAEARERVRAGLAAETHRELPMPLIEAAWSRLHFTDRIDPAAFDAFVKDAKDVGFLRHAVPLDRFFSRQP
jgi:NitT/TauT family transport system substrate-binding protein